MATETSRIEESKRSIWEINDLQPKSYQKRISQKTDARIESKKGGIIIAPTGAGKSYILSDIAYKRIQENKPIIITQPSRSLLEQNIETLVELGIINETNKHQVSVLVNKNEPVYWDNQKSPENKIEHGLNGKIIFATCGSLIRAQNDIKNYLKTDPFMLFDEFHRAGAQETKQIIKLFKQNIIGLTATPFRSDYYDLGELFNDTLQNVIIDIVSYQEAIDEGTIVPGKISLGSRKRFQELVGQKDIWNLENIFDSKEDRNNTDNLSQQIFGKIFQKNATKEEKKLAQKMVSATVKLWQERSENRNTITHAENISHAKMLFEAFKSLNNLGQKHTVAYIDADEAMYFNGYEFIHAKGIESKRLRQKILKDAKDNKIKNIINCHVLKEGINIPAASCTLMACYRRSLGPAIQTIGRTSRSYTDPLTSLKKQDHLIIDTGTTLSHIAKYDMRFQYGEINIQNVDRQNKFNYELIKKLGFFGIPQEQLENEHLSQEEDNKKRLSHFEISKISQNVKNIMMQKKPEEKIQKIDLKDYKGEDAHHSTTEISELTSLGSGAWASFKNNPEKTTLFIFRKDALNKIFPFFVNKDTNISDFITIKIGEDQKIKISHLNNSSEISDFLKKEGFSLTREEKITENKNITTKTTQGQTDIIKYQYESIRKNYLARLISPVFAQKSKHNADIAITLGKNWHDISKSFSDWLKENKTKTPIIQRQNSVKKQHQDDTLTICAIPGYYDHKDMERYLERSIDLSYQFNNVIIIGNAKNTSIKKIIEHYQKNNIKTTVINPTEMLKNINHPKYKPFTSSWKSKKLKFFGTHSSIQKTKTILKSSLNKQKDAERIIA